eukprot:6198826-Pleurochrysis_carterae.AAC.5
MSAVAAVPYQHPDCRCPIIRSIPACRTSLQVSASDCILLPLAASCVPSSVNLPLLTGPHSARSVHHSSVLDSTSTSLRMPRAVS